MDKLETGFLVWKPLIKTYYIDDSKTTDTPIWETSSITLLQCIENLLSDTQWIQEILLLWGQESNRANSNADVRNDNYQFVKMIGQSLFID